MAFFNAMFSTYKQPRKKQHHIESCVVLICCMLDQASGPGQVLLVGLEWHSSTPFSAPVNSHATKQHRKMSDTVL
jgi:hypothetical protein